MTWITGQIASFDLETTGVDPATARIVSAAVVRASADGIRTVRRWLVDPGVDIPEAASAVHGITTEQARRDGQPAALAIDEITAALHECWAGGVPVVVFNAAYDLTLLGHELARHGLPPLRLGPVLDPLVIWRHAERYRKGKKTLADAAERFGVPVVDAHAAEADAGMALAVLHGLAELVPLAALSLDTLMALQAGWHREWAVNFGDWLRSQGADPSGSIRRGQSCPPGRSLSFRPCAYRGSRRSSSAPRPAPSQGSTDRRRFALPLPPRPAVSRDWSS